MRALVIVGATGFVGGHLRRAVAGWTDVVLVTRGSHAASAGEHVVRGDIRDPSSLAAALPRRSVIVNLAYDADAPAEANLAAAQGLATLGATLGVERLIHVSTATVVGPRSGPWITEETACQPVTAYQRTKLAIEATLRARAAGTFPLVVLRPTAVFGAGGLNLQKLVHDLQTRPRLENDLRTCLFGRRAMHLVPVETVVAAMTFAAISPAVAAGGLYQVAADDGPDNTFAHVDGLLRRALGVAPPATRGLHAPMVALTSVLRVTGRLSLDPRARFSAARLRGAGFVPPVTFADALARYAAAARDGR